MTKEQLIQRWQTGHYAQIKKDFDALLNEINLTTLKTLAETTAEGRLDLRGLSLLSMVSDRVTIENSFENIDFSYSEIGQTVNFTCCQFTNCLFKNCRFEMTLFWGSQWRDCFFFGGQINTNFGSTAERKPAEKGQSKFYYNQEQYGYESLNNCVFNKVTFKKYADIGAICKHCVFEDCEFHRWEISGTFEDCQFIGVLHNVLFHGHQFGFNSDYTPTAGTLFNSMKNVDFSKCQLGFMAFRSQCDLSQIIPPDPKTHLVVKYSLAFAEKVEALGKARGMDKQGLWVQNLYHRANVSRAYYLQKFPHMAEMLSYDNNFERHAADEPWGVISVYDCLKNANKELRQFNQDWFEICCEAALATQ